MLKLRNLVLDGIPTSEVCTQLVSQSLLTVEHVQLILEVLVLQLLCLDASPNTVDIAAKHFEFFYNLRFIILHL